MGTQRDQQHWHVRVLGSFRLTRGGHEIHLPPSSAQLLALLAVRGGPVSRGTVVRTLWPDAPAQRAAANLRTAAWRLPPAARDVVVRDRSTWSLTAGAGTDLSALRRHLAALARGDLPPPGPASHDLCATLLPDWYDDWVLVEREALRLQQIRGLEQLADRLLRSGRPVEALDAALAAAAAEPLRENPQRLLVSAHLAEGNLAEGVRAYLAYRDVLAEHLGVAPSPELAAMFQGVDTDLRRDAAVTVPSRS